MERQSTWRSLIGNASEGAKSRERSQSKYLPNRNASDSSDLFASMINRSRSRLNESLLEDKSQRGNSLSREASLPKNSRLRDRKVHFSGIEDQAPFESPSTKPLSSPKSASLLSELHQLKRDFKKFQEFILDQLKKQEQVLEKMVTSAMSTIATNIPLPTQLPQFDFHSIAQSLEATPKVAKAKTPKLQKPLEGREPKKTKADPFGRFFEAMAQLKTDLKGLSDLNPRVEGSEGRGPKTVRPERKMNKY